MYVAFLAFFASILLTCILTVGAMFYLSPTLTVVMLAVVPPVSLGAVRLEIIGNS